jgi:hypothetical protein
LTRHRPFEAYMRNELVVKICAEPPTPLLDLRPDLSPELAAVVERCLVKAPGARYANADEMIAALHAVREWSGAAPPSVAPLPPPPSSARVRIVVPDEMAVTLAHTAPMPGLPPSPAASIIPPTVRSSHAAHRFRDRWALGLIVVATALGFGALYVVMRTEAPPPFFPTEGEAVPLTAEPFDPRPIDPDPGPPLPVPSVAKPKPLPKPSVTPSATPTTAKPPVPSGSTTTIVIPPIVLPPIFAPPSSNTSFPKPKIGAADAP